MQTKSLNLMGLLVALLTSCNTIYFTEPQPVDSKNLYEFPSKLQGVWMDGEDTIMVGKTFYRSISYIDKQLPASVADTSPEYILMNGKIFIVHTDGPIRLSGGVPFQIRHDTLFYKDREIVEVFLDGKTFLRKVGNRYLLNVKSDDLWWELVLVEKTREGIILGRRLSTDDMDKLPNVKPVFVDDDVRFYDLKWKEAEVADFIDKGCFSDTIIHLTPDSKIRKRVTISYR